MGPACGMLVPVMVQVMQVLAGQLVVLHLMVLQSACTGCSLGNNVWAAGGTVLTMFSTCKCRLWLEHLC